MHTGVAQLVEQWSPKPKVVGSIPTARANFKIPMKGIVSFLKGSYAEFAHHVTWPKWNELQSSTIVIAVCTLFLAIFLFGVDTFFGDAINRLYQVLK